MDEEVTDARMRERLERTPGRTLSAPGPSSADCVVCSRLVVVDGDEVIRAIPEWRSAWLYAYVRVI